MNAALRLTLAACMTCSATQLRAQERDTAAATRLTPAPVRAQSPDTATATWAADRAAGLIRP